MRKQIDDVDAQQAQNLELLARRLLLREHLLQDAVGLRALGCGRWNLLPRRQSDLPFRRCLSRCRDDCSPEATNEFYSSGPQPFEGFLWHGCVRSVNARETRTGDLRPGVAAAAGPHHPASSRSGPRGDRPTCLYGHRERVRWTPRSRRSRPARISRSCACGVRLSFAHRGRCRRSSPASGGGYCGRDDASDR